ncbi:MAG: hypothetical protein WD027_00875 [Gaiellales bacterium]
MALRDRRAARLRRALDLPRLALLALYGLAAVVATWPAARLGDDFAAAGGLGEGHGEPPAGDHLQLTYRLWLVGHQLGRGDAPWRDPYSFQPLVEPQLSLSGWPFGLPYWPLEAAFGPVVAWNLLVLATTVGAGLLTHAWLRSLALPPLAATVGGLAFAIAPYRLAQGGWHLLGWISLLLPLALLAIERSRTAATPARAHAWGAVCAISLVTLPLSGQVHLALGAVPFVLVYAFVRPGPVSLAWCAGGMAGAVAVGIALRYTVIAGSPEATTRSLAEVDKFSAEWIDFLDRWHRGASEEFVFLGWLTPVLAVAGLVLLLRRERALAVLLGVAAAVPVLLALGTNLPLYSALWDALPPFRFPRVPERLLPIAVLALAALAAFAVGRRRLAGRAALVLVALDLAVLPLGAAADDPGNRAYAALRGSEGRYLDLPLLGPGNHLGAVYDYYALQARRERPAGYSTLAPQEAFDFVQEFDLEDLRRLDVRAVLLHRGVYEQAGIRGASLAQRELFEAGYRPVESDGAVTLFIRP